MPNLRNQSVTLSLLATVLSVVVAVIFFTTGGSSGVILGVCFAVAAVLSAFAAVRLRRAGGADPAVAAVLSAFSALRRGGAG